MSCGGGKDGWEVQQTDAWPQRVRTAPRTRQQEVCMHAECSGLRSPAWGTVGSRCVGSGSTLVENQAVRAHQLGRRAVGKREGRARRKRRGMRSEDVRKRPGAGEGRAPAAREASGGQDPRWSLRCPSPVYTLHTLLTPECRQSTSDGCHSGTEFHHTAETNALVSKVPSSADLSSGWA